MENLSFARSPSTLLAPVVERACCDGNRTRTTPHMLVQSQQNGCRARAGLGAFVCGDEDAKPVPGHERCSNRSICLPIEQYSTVQLLMPSLESGCILDFSITVLSFRPNHRDFLTRN